MVEVIGLMMFHFKWRSSNTNDVKSRYNWQTSSVKHELCKVKVNILFTFHCLNLNYTIIKSTCNYQVHLPRQFNWKNYYDPYPFQSQFICYIKPYFQTIDLLERKKLKDRKSHIKIAIDGEERQIPVSRSDGAVWYEISYYFEGGDRYLVSFFSYQ